MKILMVCLGNICRSPLAEGIMQNLIDDKNLNWHVDSAGTSNYHINEHPDPRSIKKAKEYKIDISNLLGRQINKEDLDSFDLIYVMDKSNYSNVMELAVNEKQKEKIKLILNESEPNKNLEVPDPYWSSDDGFENVYQMLNKACIEIIRKYA